MADNGAVDYRVYTIRLYVDNAYMYGCMFLNFNADCEFREKFFRDSNLKEKNIISLSIGNPKHRYIHKSKKVRIELNLDV